MHSTEALAGPIQVIWGDPAYIEWLATNALTDSNATSSPQADVDSDSLPNLLEYVLGTNPRTSNLSAITQSFVNGCLQVTVPYPANLPAGATVQLQTSNNLVQWSTAPPSTVLSTTNGIRTYRLGVGEKFTRFRVELP